MNEHGNPRPLLTIQPHLRFIVEMALPYANVRAAGLCSALGEHLWQLGVYSEAQGYHEQALALFLDRLGAQHPDTKQTRQMLTTLDADPTSTAQESGM